MNRPEYVDADGRPPFCRNLVTGTAGRLSTAREWAGDWEQLTGLVALTLAHCWLAGPAADGKLLKAVTRLHTQACSPHARALGSPQCAARV